MGRRQLGILLLAGVLVACSDCSGETAAGSIACNETAACPSGLVCRDGRCARPGDADGDGLDDLHDNCPDVSNIDQADHDGDGQGDVCDDDRDGDGHANDKDNCADIANPGQQDVDKDSIGDVCDPDRDGDGVANATDNCPDLSNANQSDRDSDGKGDLCDDDRDGDGVKNDVDNCPDASNSDQADQDQDGSGDRCDASIDDDADGVDNASDNCPTIVNPDQADADADGIGDACDPDADGDGVLDNEDNCPTTRNPDQSDLDADGEGDACDADLDGDGVANGVDNCASLVNSDQADGDSDGLGDACDDDGFRTGGPSNAECKLKVRQAFQTAEEWRWPGYGSLPAGLYDYSTLYGNQLRNRVMMTPAVGDIDADGVTDVVFTSYAMYGTMLGGGALVAIDGRNGQTLWASAPATNLVAPGAGIAIANLDQSADHTMEIVAVRYSGGLAVFDSSGTVLWSCASTGNCRDYLHNGMSWGGPAIADLDADGTPEIVYGATAYQRQASGLYTILWDHSSASTGAGDNGVGPLSIVADLDLDGSPEVVTGKTAYLADGTVYWDHPNDMDGFAALGNFDADEYPEIVVVSDARIMLREHDGSIAWGPYALPFPNASLAFRGGAPTVADFDGDGFPEVSVATNGMYAVFDTDGSLLWSTLTQDLSSAATGSSVFDFEGDGWSEVVYNDERKLRVYDGETGTVLFEADNPTATAYEYPVIVDVDGDAQAEIVVASNPYGASSLTGLTCYGDPSWVSTRSIWNQHSYHVTNIEESGTVPASETASWKAGTFEGWTIGDYGGSYRANATPPLSTYVPAADLDADGFDVDRSSCGSSVTVRFWVENRGATEAPAGVQVSVYRSSVDPANLVETRQTSKALAAGEAERMSVDVSGFAADETLVIVVDEADAVSECAGKGNNTVEIVGAGCP